MRRFDDRQGFLLSVTLHLLVLMGLARSPAVTAPTSKESKPKEDKKDLVFMPPKAVLRQLVPVPPPPPVRRRAEPRVEPPPPPPDARKKDRISIGGPSEVKPKAPIILKKDEPVQAAKGNPNAGPSAPPEAPQAAQAAPPPGGAPSLPGVPGLRLPPGLGEDPRGTEGSKPRPGPDGPISESLRRLDRRLQESGQAGLLTGTGQQMGPLFFDPEGADFTVWINHFRMEVYRNWIVPQPALLGFRGHVDIEFTVERDGKVTNLRVLKSSGTSTLDKAAENALLGSRFMALPSDYGPPRVTMQVSFFYNEGPRPS